MKLAFAAFLFAVLAGGVSAHAQGPGYGCGGYGWGGPYYSIYGYEHIPYYALHPPVYYSYPIPRTYGYSPFAYPPGTMTPELHFEEPLPQTMMNPYVPRDGEAAAEPEQTAGGPLRIVNPFVAADRPAEAQLTSGK